MTAPGRDPARDEPGPEPSISPPQRPPKVSTVEVAEALDVARRLAAAGIPIFVARRNPAMRIGFTLPDRWQHTIPDPSVVDSWRSGDALCMVCGHGLDLVDIDPRNGGTLAALDGICPDVYARAATPSGGEHLLVKSLGVGSRDDVVPGIDVKAGTDGGADHGFAFLAPTVRKSKVAGAWVAYRWTTPPDLDALAEEGPGDTTGEALAKLVREARGEGGGEGGRSAVQGDSPFAAPAAPYAPSPWVDLPERIFEGNRHPTVLRLSSSLRGHSVPHHIAVAVLETGVWPRLDQAGDPYTRAEFLADIADAYSRYPAGHSGAAAEVGDLDEGGARRVVLVRGSDIRAEHVEYLDEGLIPLRTVTLVTGLDGVGKSTILYEKAARLTRGTLKGHYFGIPSDVVIASSEDHPASVIIPRLVAAGADLDRIHVVRVRFVEGLDGDVSLPDDLDAIARRVAEVNARMLIVDPLVAHMPLNVDSHKAQHVRSVMAPLAHLAEEAHLAVCAVVHFNGSPSTDVRTRISGSKALRDASRSVLVCGPDPADDDRMVMIQDKNSFGPRSATGWGYRIEPAAVQIDGVTYDTSRVRWLGDVAITSRGLLGGALDPDERGERDLARDAILDALAGGEHDWAALGRLIRAEGVSEITGRRARDELRREGLIAKRKRGAAGWVWNLLTPPEDDPDPDRVSKFDNAHSRNGFEATDPPENEELAHPLDGEQVEQVRGSTAAADAPDPNPNRGRYGTVLMVEEEEALVRFRQGKAELDDAADLLREILGAEEVEE